MRSDRLEGHVQVNKCTVFQVPSVLCKSPELPRFNTFTSASYVCTYLVFIAICFMGEKDTLCSQIRDLVVLARTTIYLIERHSVHQHLPGVYSCVCSCVCCWHWNAASDQLKCPSSPTLFDGLSLPEIAQLLCGTVAEWDSVAI